VKLAQMIQSVKKSLRSTSMLTNILRHRPGSSTLLAATLLLWKHNDLRLDLYSTEFDVPAPLAIEKETKFFPLHRKQSITPSRRANRGKDAQPFHDKVD
jgi:hypothetical protein